MAVILNKYSLGKIYIYIYIYITKGPTLFLELVLLYSLYVPVSDTSSSKACSYTQLRFLLFFYLRFFFFKGEFIFLFIKVYRDYIT